MQFRIAQYAEPKFTEATLRQESHKQGIDKEPIWQETKVSKKLTDTAQELGPTDTVITNKNAGTSTPPPPPPPSRPAPATAPTVQDARPDPATPTTLYVPEQSRPCICQYYKCPKCNLFHNVQYFHNHPRHPNFTY